MAMQNIKLTVEYKGTAFAGWQIQAGQATVQGEIVEAIYRTTGKKVGVHGAGRTDAGVHALGQVANFRIDHHIEPGRYTDALNYYLPEDIRVREAVAVPVDFHARKSAKWKRYRYVIAGERSALWREYRWEIEGRGASRETNPQQAAGYSDPGHNGPDLRDVGGGSAEGSQEHCQDHKGPDLQEEKAWTPCQARGDREGGRGDNGGSRGDTDDWSDSLSGRKRPDLRLDLLREAASLIVGEHDFAPFCVTASRKADNRCRIDHARWQRVGPLLVFEIRGNRFLHNMVRSLVGAMVNLAGETRDRHPDNLTLDRFADIIQAPKEQRIVFTAPARGLYLVSVHY